MTIRYLPVSRGNYLFCSNNFTLRVWHPFIHFASLRLFWAEPYDGRQQPDARLAIFHKFILGQNVREITVSVKKAWDDRIVRRLFFKVSILAANRTAKGGTRTTSTVTLTSVQSRKSWTRMFALNVLWFDMPSSINKNLQCLMIPISLDCKTTAILSFQLTKNGPCTIENEIIGGKQRNSTPMPSLSWKVVLPTCVVVELLYRRNARHNT